MSSIEVVRRVAQHQAQRMARKYCSSNHCSSNRLTIIDMIEQLMWDTLETQNPASKWMLGEANRHATTIQAHIRGYITRAQCTLPPKPSLDKLVEDIEELVLSDKEYSHNIIGLKLELIEKHYGVEKAAEVAKWAGMECTSN